MFKLLFIFLYWVPVIKELKILLYNFSNLRNDMKFWAKYNGCDSVQGKIWIFRSWYRNKPVLRIGIRIWIRRIHLFLGLPDPHPDPISQRYVSGAFYQAKIVRKTLIPTVLWLLYDFLSLKNDVKVPSKSNEQRTFCWVFKVTDGNSRIWIRIRIH